jgi:hypothetical protein
MKALSALLAVAALVLAPAAAAKFKMSLTLGDSTPKVGQPFTVVIGSERDLDYDLRLIAVAPGKDWFNVTGTITGDTSRPHAQIPRDGFEVKLTRRAPNRWRGLVTFSRPGRWTLLIPNGAPVGVMIPPPVLRTIVVR